MKKYSLLFSVFSLFAAGILSGCMEWDYENRTDDISLPGHGLFITCEGNFQYGNASLSYYDPATSEVSNELFLRANGMKLGDVVQSMTIHGDQGWLVVNNSHVVFSVDINNLRETGRITGLTSPRYIHFVNDRKAYVSQLWDNRIFIVDPQTHSITGHITVPGMDAGNGSTEQMVQVGNFVYCNCWSYQSRIIKIDTHTDDVTATLDVGQQPKCLVKDFRGNLWVLTDGDNAALLHIDTESWRVDRRYAFGATQVPTALIADASGHNILWINGGVYRIDVDALFVPSEPLIPSSHSRFYALTVSPYNGDVYVADAIDYQQPSAIYRYTADGRFLEKFYAGITAGSFCWK